MTAGGPAQSAVNAFWAGNAVVVVRRGRDGKVSKHEVPAEHCCFVRRSDFTEKIERQVRASRFVAGVRVEGNWLRIRWKARDLCKAACLPGGWFDKLGMPTFEGNVDPVRRWVIDNDVEVQVPRRCYLDLESDPRPGFARREEMRVIYWALADDEGELVQGELEEDTDESERLLLEDLYDELMAYDQVCAWNGDRFDFPLLRARTKQRGISVEPRRWLWCDHMLVFQKGNMHSAESGEEKVSLALDRVAQAVLGRGKRDVNAKEIFELWAAGGEARARAADYNLNDVVLMRDIERETGFLGVYQAVCELTGVFFDTRAINPVRYVGSFAMRLSKADGHKFPTRFEPEHEEEQRQYEGGYVLLPTRRGILKDVHVCDFAGMYPSILTSWNMSPETWARDVAIAESLENRPAYLRHVPVERRPIPDGHCAAPNDTVFRCEPVGLIPRMCAEIGRQRKVWTDKKAQCVPGSPEFVQAERRAGGLKIVNNSVYGAAGCVWSPIYEREVAESCTTTGAWLLKTVIAEAESQGIHALYGDTDSAFFQDVTRERFREFVEWCNRELFPRLTAEKRCLKNALKLEAEKGFERIVLVGKKRYAGRYSYYKGTAASSRSKPEVKGLEYKRGDSVRLARRMQAEALDLLLGGGILSPRVDHCEEDPEVFWQHVLRWRQRILEQPLQIEDVVLSKSLSQPLKAYARKLKKDGTAAAQPPHVQVGHELVRRGELVDAGTRVEYFVTDGRSPQKVAPAADFGKLECDRYYLWDSLVYPATMRVLQAAFPERRWRDLLKVRPPSERVRLSAEKQVRKKDAEERQGNLF